MMSQHPPRQDQPALGTPLQPGNPVVNWMKQHKLWTAVIAVVLIAGLANLAGGDADESAEADPVPAASASRTMDAPMTEPATPEETTETAVMVVVPAVVDIRVDEAQNLVADANLAVDLVLTDAEAAATDDSVFLAEEWMVVAQEPTEGTSVEQDSRVILTIDRAEEPAELSDPATVEMTDEEALAVLQAYMDERAASGVMIAQTLADLSLEDGVATATFDPSLLDWDEAFFKEISPFENLAEFVGLDACWATPESAAVRARIAEIDTQFVSGNSLGSATTEELHRLCVG